MCRAVARPIVARIATLAAEMRSRPENYLGRERDISAALATRGINVITPTDLVDPGPHDIGGTAFLLLRHHDIVPLDTTSRADALRAGRSFAELSAALGDLSIGLGAVDQGHPWAEIAALVGTVASTTADATMERITEVIDALRRGEPDDPWQLVHGDAHRVNVAVDDRGQIIWFDFEDANRRPLAWDLATLRRSWPAAGEEASQLLGVDSDSYSMRWHHELREVYALLWNLLYSQRFARAPSATAQREATWLARPIDHHLRPEGDR